MIPFGKRCVLIKWMIPFFGKRCVLIKWMIPLFGKRCVLIKWMIPFRRCTNRFSPGAYSKLSERPSSCPLCVIRGGVHYALQEVAIHDVLYRSVKSKIVSRGY